MQRGYDGELLGGTFSRAVFVGNGLIAIVAGLVAHSLVETLGLGPVAPFDAAALVMVFGGVIVLFSWTENFGNCSEKKSFLEQLKSGAHAIANGEECRSASCVLNSPYHFVLIRQNRLVGADSETRPTLCAIRLTLSLRI